VAVGMWATLSFKVVHPQGPKAISIAKGEAVKRTYPQAAAIMPLSTINLPFLLSSKSYQRAIFFIILSCYF
jgi:hypothetical protein